MVFLLVIYHALVTSDSIDVSVGDISCVGVTSDSIDVSVSSGFCARECFLINSSRGSTNISFAHNY